MINMDWSEIIYEWNDFVYHLHSTKVNITNPWLLLVGYMSLMATAFPKIKSITSEWGQCDLSDPVIPDRLGRVIGASVLLVAAPIWIAAWCVVLMPMGKVTMFVIKRLEKIFACSKRY